MKRIGIFISLLFLFFACQKPEDRSCAKKTGETDTLEISLNNFDMLYLHEHLEYELIQDSTNKVVIIGGKNLLNFIKAEVTDGLLDISNENKCSFLRDYKRKVKVEIHFTRIGNIHFEGSEKMTCRDTLEFDWLTLLIRDGAGPVELNFNAQDIFAVVSHGWGDFTLNGTTNSANLNVRSNGFCDTYGLKVKDSLTVISRTEGYVKINTNGVPLKAQTEQGGDIYYKGTPTSIKFNRYGTGDLIDSN